eukprot:1147329-Pelagomonas_calceolata.AAC.5
MAILTVSGYSMLAPLSVTPLLLSSQPCFTLAIENPLGAGVLPHCLTQPSCFVLPVLTTLRHLGH